MQSSEHKCYHFNKAQHWQAGIADQIEISDMEISMSAQMKVVPLPATNAIDNTVALAIDPCGVVHWVRESSFELVRVFAEGTLTVGHLSCDENNWQPAGLVIDLERIWLLVNSKTDYEVTKIFRYFTNDFQRSETIDLDRPILDLTGDNQDGVWLLLGRDGVLAELLHLDHSGDIAGRITLPAPLEQGRIVMDESSDILVLDFNVQTIDPCLESLAWRIWWVNSCEKVVSVIFSLPRRDLVCNHDIPDFTPNLMVVDKVGRIQLLEGHTGALWSLSNTGEILLQLKRVMSPQGLPIQSFISNDAFFVSAAFGIGKLAPTASVQATTPASIPTYITPVLISPDGVQSGWMRADIDVDFSAGTAIEISVASTTDRKLLDEIALLFANQELSALTRLYRINERLQWTDERIRVYQGGDWPNGSPLRFPLHEIDATHLWLRIRIYTTGEASAPRLKSMRVFYPNISYSQYLPAVYQEDESSAKLLRRVLSIMESLFGDLDAQLTELPHRIDPKTAPEDWLPFLLRWLGLPAPTELNQSAQRNLLIHAPKLLRDRGTRGALEKLLKILVGSNNDFVVNDNSEGPLPWTLPNKQISDYGSRLGCDTLVMVQKQPGFYLGCSAGLGVQQLGYTALNTMQLFARNNGAITIRIVASSADREWLEPLLIRYLQYFIPAHCRYLLFFVSQQSELRKPPILNSETRIHSDSPPRLAEDTRVGRMRITGEKSGGIILGQSIFSDNGLYFT